MVNFFLAHAIMSDRAFTFRALKIKYVAILQHKPSLIPSLVAITLLVQPSLMLRCLEGVCRGATQSSYLIHGRHRELVVSLVNHSTEAD